MKSSNDAGASVPLAVDRIGLPPQISYVAAAIINVGRGGVTITTQTAGREFCCKTISYRVYRIAYFLLRNTYHTIRDTRYGFHTT